jgi:subtilisin-like proprotein convertase family protein
LQIVVFASAPMGALIQKGGSFMSRSAVKRKPGFRFQVRVILLIAALISAGLGLLPYLPSAEAGRDLGRDIKRSSPFACQAMTLTNTAPIALDPGPANNGSVYPSTIEVSGADGNVATSAGAVEVTLHGFSHSFPDDIGIVLVSPSGAALLIQDGAGAGPDMTDVTYKLSDLGAENLPDGDVWEAGTYKPTSWYEPGQTEFPSPGPGLDHQNPGPEGDGTATFASVFGGKAANGTWSLFIRDFAGGDGGEFAGGWTLTITTDGCQNGTPTPTVTPSVTPSPTPPTLPPGTFAATNTGSIPDDDCSGSGRQLRFAVSGMSAPVSGIQVSFTGTHTYVGDLDVLLIAPGGSPDEDVFTFTGNDEDPTFGDSSNLNGTYNFLDMATASWWDAATKGETDFVIPPGDYRASNIEGENISLDSAFAGVMNPNGTWVLKINDCEAGDTGTITAGVLRFSVPMAADASVSGRILDPNGRGIRNAIVTISGPGFERRVITSSLGYYQFDLVPVGQTYNVEAVAKRFTFVSQSVVPSGDVNDLDLIGVLTEP